METNTWQTCCNLLCLVEDPKGIEQFSLEISKYVTINLLRQNGCYTSKMFKLFIYLSLVRLFSNKYILCMSFHFSLILCCDFITIKFQWLKTAVWNPFVTVFQDVIVYCIWLQLPDNDTLDIILSEKLFLFHDHFRYWNNKNNLHVAEISVLKNTMHAHTTGWKRYGSQ